LIVRLTMTIDGEPFRAPRERYIDELLKQADANADGRPTWSEALLNLRFTLERFGARRLERSAAEALARQFDRNGDGLVDRAELRAFLTPNSGGDALVIYRGSLTRSASPDLRPLLDADGDGELSANEIDAAPARLKSGDANEDEWLDRDDFLPEGAGLLSRPETIVERRRTASSPSRVLELGPSADLQEIYDALRARYAGADGRIHRDDFSRNTNLGRDLDLDGNGVIDSAEIAALPRARPHIDLEINLGQTTAHSRGLKLTSYNFRPGLLGDELSLTDARLTVTLPEVALSFVSSPFPLHSFARNKATATSLIGAEVSEAGPPLFAGLDVNGDGRLSLREMQNAARRLAAFDRNGDGKVSPVEMPGTIVIAFNLGTGRYMGPPIDVAVGEEPLDPQPAGRPFGPVWFTRMDRNNDGDLSPDEFLGTRAQFDEFDADHNGLIDAAEARAAPGRGR
jgi:Ca2+-binding EF-hand superfamily protein